MLTVHFLGQGRISLDEISRPEPRDQDVVVRIRSAAICGTDRENLEVSGQEKVPGHESAGEAAFSLFRSAECGKILFTA
jgi:threonine dehydrogenase-like Zn-dependent dehydrogenase